MNSTLNHSTFLTACSRIARILARKPQPEKSIMEQHIENMPTDAQIEAACLTVDFLAPASERPPQAEPVRSPEEAAERHNEFRRQFPFPAPAALHGDDSYSAWYRQMAAVWAERARQRTEEAQLDDCDIRAVVVTFMNKWRIDLIEDAGAATA